MVHGSHYRIRDPHEKVSTRINFLSVEGASKDVLLVCNELDRLKVNMILGVQFSEFEDDRKTCEVDLKSETDNSRAEQYCGEEVK